MPPSPLCRQQPAAEEELEAVVQDSLQRLHLVGSVCCTSLLLPLLLHFVRILAGAQGAPCCCHHRVLPHAALCRCSPVYRGSVGRCAGALGRPALGLPGLPLTHSCRRPAWQVRCHSSFDFLASLAVARPVLAHLAAHGGIRCVLVDNIAAYYYLDRVGRGPSAAAAPALGQLDITRCAWSPGCPSLRLAMHLTYCFGAP